MEEMLRVTVPLTGFDYLLAKSVYLAVCENELMVALLFKRSDKTAKTV